MVVHEQSRSRLLRSRAYGCSSRTVAAINSYTCQPPDPVPCLLLGQLAADRNYIGKGIGTGLLKHALQRCIVAASLIGGRALIVSAVDIEAAQFGSG